MVKPKDKGTRRMCKARSEIDKGIKKAIESVLKTSQELEDYPIIKGFDFNSVGKDGSKSFDINRFLESYFHTGFQASNMKIAIDIIKKMRQEKVTIFFGYTSNMVSSGLRDIFAYLVRHKMVHVLVTTAGGVEEDIIKTMKPFVLGSFRAKGAELREKGINRIGNIYVPNDRYIEFEKLMNSFFTKMQEKIAKEGKNCISAQELIFELGKEVNDENSILYWATRNNIPIFCPALTDGSIGDMLYFYKKKHPEFKIDISDDIVKINDIAINADKTGAIILGGSVPKHHIMNANLFREGTAYTVYINTSTEGDGSNAGARPEEAVSWGKQSIDAASVHVEGDATIIFPLVVAGAFIDK